MKNHAISRTVFVLLALALAVATGVMPVAPALARTDTPATPPAAQSYSATIAEARIAANALLAQTGAASLSVALVDGEKVVWSEGFGYADMATSAKPEATTMYGIGSVSKMLATVAVMKLVDQGKLNLDAPVSRYLPAFRMASPEYRRVTVRMLLNHTSGFPGSEYRNLFGTEPFRDYPQQTMSSLGGERLKDAPGTLGVYCNDGFTMVENLVPAVTGKTYAQFVADEVFAPLEMQRSAYPLGHFAEGTYAKAYTGSTPNPQEFANALGSGGLYSTPSDMSHLASMLMNGGVYKGTRVLSAASVNEMGKDQTIGTFSPATTNAMRFGLGWDTVTEPSLTAVGISGWAKGGDTRDYHASFIVAPTQDLAVVVTAVAPLDSGACGLLGEEILLGALAERGTIDGMPAPISTVAPPVKNATAAQLAGMKGYWAMSGKVFRISASPSDAKSLTIDLLTPEGWGEMASGLKLRTDGRFYSDGSPTSYCSMPAGGRQYLVMNRVGGLGHYRDDMMIGQKLRSAPTLSKTWRGRIGQEWLAVNQVPSSLLWTIDGGPVVTLGEIPGFPGYITADLAEYGLQVQDPSAGPNVAAMFLHIPGIGSRDLNDLIVEKRGGQERLRWGSEIYRLAETVPVLAAGTNRVSFGPEGFADWRTLANAASVNISGATGWCLYDAEMRVVGSGSTFPVTVHAPEAGSRLLLFGARGSRATVSVTAEQARTTIVAPSAKRAITQLGLATGGIGITATRDVANFAANAPKASVYVPPAPEDLSALSWTESFDALHSKMSREYAFTNWKGINWRAMKTKYRPRIAAAQAAGDLQAYYLTLREYLKELPDGHVSIKAFGDAAQAEIDAVEQKLAGGGFGLVVTRLDDGSVVASWVKAGGPAARAGMQAGAQILAWDGQPVDVALSRTSTRLGPNQATEWRKRYEQSRYLVRAPVGATRTVSFRNRGQNTRRMVRLTAIDDALETLVRTDDRSSLTMNGWPEHAIEHKILPGNVGYMRIFLELDIYHATPDDTPTTRQLFRTAMQEFIDANVSGVILDIRANAGGMDSMVPDFMSSFYPRKTLYEYQNVFNASTNRFELWLADDSGRFIPGAGLWIEPATSRYAGPVVALVNNGCGSSGEGVAMGIKNLPNGRVVGFEGTNGSFGMAGDKVLMPGNFEIDWPFGQSLNKDKVVQIDSRNGQGGILPNSKIPMTLQNALRLANGEDVVLEYGLRALRTMR